MSKIILCSGGARSGKSEFAESLALSLPGKKTYVATAQIFDEEMKLRIEVHKRRRGPEWSNHEVHYDLPGHWEAISQGTDVILIDCVTMYVTNLLLSYDIYKTPKEMEEAEKTILNSIDQLIEKIKATNTTVIFVTNEIGFGVIPENMLARVFRDIAGHVNQKIAKESAHVYLTISGVTIDLKAREVTING